MCAARGKFILTLVFHTILYLHPKFQQIIFQIDQTTVTWSSPPIYPPLIPPVILTKITPQADLPNFGRSQKWPPGEKSSMPWYSGSYSWYISHWGLFDISQTLHTTDMALFTICSHIMSPYRDELSKMPHYMRHFWKFVPIWGHNMCTFFQSSHVCSGEGLRNIKKTSMRYLSGICFRISWHKWFFLWRSFLGPPKIGQIRLWSDFGQNDSRSHLIEMTKRNSKMSWMHYTSGIESQMKFHMWFFHWWSFLGPPKIERIRL